MCGEDVRHLVVGQAGEVVDGAGEVSCKHSAAGDSFLHDVSKDFYSSPSTPVADWDPKAGMFNRQLSYGSTEDDAPVNSITLTSAENSDVDDENPFLHFGLHRRPEPLVSAPRHFRPACLDLEEDQARDEDNEDNDGMRETTQARRSPNVATPQTSKSHVDMWSMAEETLIFFDWDDTLCPTTYIWTDPRLKWNEVAPCFADPSLPTYPSTPSDADPSTPNDKALSGSFSSQASLDKSMLDRLEEHQGAVIALLRIAVAVGTVVIITMAEDGFVETSCRNFMPKVWDILSELHIEVTYARTSLSSRFVRKAREEENDLTKVLKTRAMSKMIKKFYGHGRDGSKSRNRSWKNVISIGDSSAERSALQDVILRKEQRDSRGVPKECRCKVVKLITEPSLERLTAQLQALVNWIATIAGQDGDIDIDFGDLIEDLEEDSPSPGQPWRTPEEGIAVR
jgi:hypothetical protein